MILLKATHTTFIYSADLVGLLFICLRSDSLMKKKIISEPPWGTCHVVSIQSFSIVGVTISRMSPYSLCSFVYV